MTTNVHAQASSRPVLLLQSYDIIISGRNLCDAEALANFTKISPTRIKVGLQLIKTISCVYQIQNFSSLLYTLHGGVVLCQGRVNLTVPFHLCKSWIYTCQFNDKELNSAQSILRKSGKMQSHIHVQSYNQEKEKLKSIKMETNNSLCRCRST